MNKKQEIISRALLNIAEDVKLGAYNTDGDIDTSTLMFIIGNVLAEIDKQDT